jgi:hypothetical protein
MKLNFVVKRRTGSCQNGWNLYLPNCRVGSIIWEVTTAQHRDKPYLILTSLPIDIKPNRFDNEGIARVELEKAITEWFDMVTGTHT